MGELEQSRVEEDRVVKIAKYRRFSCREQAVVVVVVVVPMCADHRDGGPPHVDVLKYSGLKSTETEAEKTPNAGSGRDLVGQTKISAGQDRAVVSE